MLSKSFEKYVKSLKQKKYRSQYQRFLAEGTKTVLEFLKEDFKIEKILAAPEWLQQVGYLELNDELVMEVSVAEMEKISSLSNPSPVMIIGCIPSLKLDEEALQQNFSLALDDIQDPGNLGTIVRIADWFGFPYVFISENSADPYNPKSVQASMGSLARIHVIETDLESLFTSRPQLPVYAADASGESIYEIHPEKYGFLLIGNEGHGFSPAFDKLITKKIAIPRYGSAESLNAAVSAGIITAHLKSGK